MQQSQVVGYKEGERKKKSLNMLSLLATTAFPITKGLSEVFPALKHIKINVAFALKHFCLCD